MVSDSSLHSFGMKTIGCWGYQVPAQAVEVCWTSFFVPWYFSCKFLDACSIFLKLPGLNLWNSFLTRGKYFWPEMWTLLEPGALKSLVSPGSHGSNNTVLWCMCGIRTASNCVRFCAFLSDPGWLYIYWFYLYTSWLYIYWFYLFKVFMHHLILSISKWCP